MRFSILIFSLLFSIYSLESCDTSPFKDGSVYNLYSLSSINACNSDVEGRMAANGPISLINYSIGLLNQANIGYSLVSSSSIDLLSVQVLHGSVIGESVTAESSSVIIDGVLDRADTCCSDSECSSCTTTAENNLPFDLDALNTALLELSMLWAGLPNTEDATVEYLYQSLTLTCGNDGFNHFTNVHLDGITSINIVCSETSSIVIDYTIDTIEMSALGISLNGGITSDKIIHHFCGPTLTVSSINVIGALFAPWSDVYFTSAVINGQAFVGSLSGSNDAISTISAAFNDECGKYGDGHAIITGPTGSMTFDAEPQAIFIQEDDGTATITGRARNGDMVFDVDVTLSDFSATAPTNSPKKELKSSCYASNGGNVNTADWVYYQTIEGTLTGTVGSTYEGAVISISRLGPSAQVGYGANGKNQNDGLSFWFNFAVEQQSYVTPFPESGYGDFNLDKELVPTTGCPDGQFNRNPFNGCVPSLSEFVCCVYENNAIINNFCSENSCVEIEGWTLLSSNSTDNCDECVCPQ